MANLGLKNINLLAKWSTMVNRPEIVNLRLLLLYNFSNEPWSKYIKGDRGRKEGISRGTNSRQKLVSFSFYDLRALPKISQVFLILKTI